VWKPAQILGVPSTVLDDDPASLRIRTEALQSELDPLGWELEPVRRNFMPSVANSETLSFNSESLGPISNGPRRNFETFGQNPEGFGGNSEGVCWNSERFGSNSEGFRWNFEGSSGNSERFWSFREDASSDWGQKEHPVPDLHGIQSGMQCPELADPTANAGLILRRERDTRMLRSFCRKAKEVLVVGTEHSGQLGGPP